MKNKQPVRNSIDDNTKIAIVYDWLDTSIGGAEKVLQNILEIYPQATIFTTYCTSSAPAFIEKYPLQTSFLQKLPFLWRNKAIISTLLPLAIESLDFRNFDLIISISSFVAKGVIVKPHQVHICYLLTPTRFLFSHQDSYLSHPPYNLPLIKFFTQKIVNYFINWDQMAAHRPDYIIPISQLITNRTTDFYHLNSQSPIYPPVNAQIIQKIIETNKAEKYQPNLAHPATYDLIICRQVKYKRIDLTIEAAFASSRSLLIIGQGPENARLKKLAIKLAHQYSSTNILQKNPDFQIIFQNQVSIKDLIYFYQHAQLFLMPGLEDFGITGLEAQICGTPVISHCQSGISELIAHQRYGFQLKDESISSLLAAYEWFEKHQSPISPSQITKNGLEYDIKYFKSQFTDQIDRLFTLYFNT